MRISKFFMVFLFVVTASAAFAQTATVCKDHASVRTLLPARSTAFVPEKVAAGKAVKEKTPRHVKGHRG